MSGNIFARPRGGAGGTQYKGLKPYPYRLNTLHTWASKGYAASVMNDCCTCVGTVTTLLPQQTVYDTAGVFLIFHLPKLFTIRLLLITIITRDTYLIPKWVAIRRHLPWGGCFMVRTTEMPLKESIKLCRNPTESVLVLQYCISNTRLWNVRKNFVVTEVRLG